MKRLSEFLPHNYQIWIQFLLDPKLRIRLFIWPAHSIAFGFSDYMWKEVAYLHSLSASMVRNRLINVMMKIILPASFIALKLTGSFIDFMLGLAYSSNQEDIDLVASQVRDPRMMNNNSCHWAISNSGQCINRHTQMNTKMLQTHPPRVKLVFGYTR